MDKKAAYCFCPVQWADHYAGCYLWPDDDLVVRPHVSMRMVFGGASWPNRFERVSLLDCAWVAECQRAFDRQHPLPSSVERWAEARRGMQSRGSLPDGDSQLWPAGIEP